HVEDEVDHAVRVAPLVVVPADDLEEALLAGQVVLQGGEAVVDGRAVVVDKVAGDDFFVGVAKNALEVRLRGLLEQGVDLFDRGILLGTEGQVDDGNVGNGDAEAHAGQLALGGGQNLADGL